MMSEEKKAAPSAKAGRRKTKPKAGSEPSPESTTVSASTEPVATAPAQPAASAAPAAPEPTPPAPATAADSAPAASTAAPAPAVEPRREMAAKPRLSEEYLLQSHFDKSMKQFIATVAEFPELRATAMNREAALLEIEDKLESHVENVRRRGDQLPESIVSRRYPEKVEIRLSQGLFRRLDNLSRHEKLPLDQLLVELIASGVERRLEAPARVVTERRPPAPPTGNTRHPQHGPHERPHGSHGQHPQHQPNRREANLRRYQSAMDNRENFMEYVRSLEKGGGGWKNRK